MAKTAGDSAAEVSVHACGPADRGEQVRLFNACFKKQIDAPALAWRYDQSPHGSTISFVSRLPDGMAVCGYACSPRFALAQGDESSRALLGETGDVMTHPDWRKKGLFSALDRACMAETARRSWPAVFGLPNRRSSHIFQELGWKKVGTVRPWTFLLKDSPVSRRVRAKEGRLQGWLVPLGVRKCKGARAQLAQRAGKRFRARALDRFPAEVADLSRAVEQRFALMVRRDAAWLDWRFAKAPSGRHRAIGLFDEGQQLAAYAIVQLPVPAKPESGAKAPSDGGASDEVGWLVDVLARDDDALAAAISAGLERLELAGAALVQADAVDGSWWCERLQEAGFLPPKASHHLDVIAWVNDPDHPISKAVLDARGWYLTDGDRDDETIGS